MTDNPNPNPFLPAFADDDLACAASLLPREVHSDSERPDTPRPALVEMREACELPDDLWGGNRRMRKKAGKWLPKEEEESETNYRCRVARSTVFPFYKDTLGDLAARPFGRDVSWEQDPPESFAEFLRDVDGSGKSLTVLARDVLLQAMHRGLVHVLVDASGSSGKDAASTAARRVYAQRIDALEMLDLRDEADADGRKRVTYCRFVMSRVRRVNKFEQVTEPVIIELEKAVGEAPGTKVEWTFDPKSKKWSPSAATAYNPGKNGIPLFTLYTEQTGPFQGQPVLEDLAWVNLAHFQSRSDHAHVMRIARLITLVTLGFRDTSMDRDPKTKGADRIVLGPLSRIRSEKGPTDASVSFLEPSGKSIELSFQDLEHLADECKRLGARHLTSKTGNVTARSVSLDDQKSVNNLQTWCLRVDVLLRQVLEAVAEWLNAGELGPKVQPRVYKEFQATGNIEAGARGLQAMAAVLCKREQLVEGIRYGILRPDFPVEENLAELEKEQAAIDAAIAAAAGTPGNNDPAPDPEDDPAAEAA